MLELKNLEENMGILEENMGSKILDIACRNFLSDLPRQWIQKKKKMGLHQTKKFLHSKGNRQKVK